MDTLPTIQLLAAAMVLLLFVQGLALVVAVRILSRTAARVENSLAETQEEVTAALRQSRATLDKVERLARSSDQIVVDQVTPTLEAARSMMGEVETSARGIREGVDGIQNAVRGMASASGSGVLALLTQTVYKRGGKFGLLALGLGAALRALMAPTRRQAQPKTGRTTDAAARKR